MLLTTEQASAFRDILAICAATPGRPSAYLQFETPGKTVSATYDSVTGRIRIKAVEPLGVDDYTACDYASPADFATAYNLD